MLFKKKLEPQTVEEWGSVTMVVELTRPWPEVKWTRNAMVLAPGKKVEIHTEGTSHSLVLHSVGFADRGFYGCETPDDKTQAKLTVESELQGSWAWGSAPRMGEGGQEGRRGTDFPPETFPGKGMEREGGGGPPTWRGTLREGLQGWWGGWPSMESNYPPVVGGSGPLPLGQHAELRPLGRSEGGPGAAAHQSHVCPAVRQVRLLRDLQAVEVQEQGSAIMEVELSHANVEGSWTRDGLRLQPGPLCHLAVQGPIHTLTLSDLRPQDGGLIAFKAEGVHTSARLVVTGAWGAGRDPLESTLSLSPRWPRRQVGTGRWNPGGEGGIRS